MGPGLDQPGYADKRQNGQPYTTNLQLHQVLTSWGPSPAFSTGEDHGQDLAEYCLLTALVALIALGIFIQA
jgi:hypothetical protein